MVKKLSKKEELAKLTKVWYAKLAKEGFKDIEPHENTLTAWHSKIINTYTSEEVYAKQVYYNMANQFLNDHQFETILERVIWEYWANGISVRNIAEQFNRVKIDKIQKSSVWKIVRRLEKQMFKHYNADHTKYKDEPA